MPRSNHAASGLPRRIYLLHQSRRSDCQPCHEDWLTYDLPLELLDKLWGGKYRGQEQKWFRMRFLGSDAQVNIETDHPEFVEWKWIDQSEMVDAIVPFKRDVYIAVLDQIGTAKP